MDAEPNGTQRDRRTADARGVGSTSVRRLRRRPVRRERRPPWAEALTAGGAWCAEDTFRTPDVERARWPATLQTYGADKAVCLSLHAYPRRNPHAAPTQPRHRRHPRCTGVRHFSHRNLYHVTQADEAAAALDGARKSSIRFCDTAPPYGLGLSERRLGACLPHRPRHEYTVSSKAVRMLVPNEQPDGDDSADEAMPALADPGPTPATAHP
jgi:hypothetical protein